MIILPQFLSSMMFTLSGAINLVAMFFNFLSICIGWRLSQNLVITSMSLSLCVIWEGQACFKVMCWSDDLKLTLHISVIFMLMVRTPGCDKVQTSRLISDKHLRLVRPVESLRLAMIVCSMQRSGVTPDQNVLVLWMANYPFLNSSWTVGFNADISCRNQ